MKRMTWFGEAATIGIAVALIGAPAAQAFFPPPTPTGVSSGEIPPTIPPVPPITFPPVTPPPTEPPVTPPVVKSTPEPTTLISALAGLTLLGGYAIRRRIK